MTSSFSLKDAIVTALIVVLIGGSALVWAQDGRVRARGNQNALQVREVSIALIEYQQRNNGFYPGINGLTGKAIGEIKPARSINYGAAKPTDTDISATYALLLNIEAISAERLISPLESDKKKKVAADLDTATLMLTQDNYSYAMLQIGSDKGNTIRRKEWRQSLNHKAPLVADRSKAIDSTLATTSLHVATKTTDSKDWKGHVAWGDGRVTPEHSGVLKAGSVTLGKHVVKGTDDLFSVNDTEDTSANAMFSYGK